MAPITKGMKRKSEAAPPADRSVAQKVGSVTKVLQDSELPKSVVSLLKGMAGKSLSVVKDTRHAHQSAVVAMIAEALDEIHASKKASVAQAQTKSASTTQEKASRIEAMDKATAALAASVAVETDKEAAAEACAAATVEKKGALKTAQKAQQAGDADLVELDKQKELLQFSQLSQILKLRSSKAVVSSLLKSAKTYGFDRGLTDALPKACTTEPANRTDFDRMVIEKVEAALAKADSDLQAQLDAQAPGRAERAAAVEAAKHSLQEAHAAEKTATTAVEAAEAAVGEAKKAMGVAKKSVSSYLPDMKRLLDDYDELKASLTAFDATRATFDELKELMPPPPEPEPVAIVEAAEEQAPEEPAAAAVLG